MIGADSILLHSLFLLLTLPQAMCGDEFDEGNGEMEGGRFRRQLTGANCAQLIVLNGQVNYLPSALASSSSLVGAVASGTTAVLTCNSGFVPQGASSATCTNSIWNPALGTCQSSTLLGGSTGLGLGTTVNPFGTGSTLPFGQSTATGQCIAQFALNGQLQYSQTQSQIGFYPAGTVAQLICTPGTTAIGSSQSVCQLGQWQPAQLGPCQSNTLLGTGGIGGIGTSTGFGTTLPSTGSTVGGCFPTVAPANAQIQYGQMLQQSGMYPQGTSAALTCLSGVPSNGQSFSTCQNGIWTPSFGLCTTTGTAIGAGTLGGVQPSVSTTGLFGTTTTTRYCLVGMLPPAGATLQYSTNNNQLLQNTLVPTTQNTLLGGLGSTNSAGPYPEGTTATVLCQQAGTVPSGQTTSTCSNGQWVPALLTGCTGGTLGTGLGTGTLLNTGLGIGNTAGQCLMGLALLGGNVVYINSGQQQISSLGTTAISSTPNLLGNSQISQFGPFPQGTVAQAQCLNGQQLNGATAATCIQGQWQPTQLGSCLANAQQLGIGSSFSTISPFQQIGQSSTLSFGTAGGIGQQCFFGLLPPLNGRMQYSNGQQVGPFPAGTVASVLCNTGFVPSGQGSAICQNGAFTPSVLGQCAQASFNPVSTASSSTSSSSTFLPTQSQSSSSSSSSFGSTTPMGNNNGSTTSGNGIVGNAQCFEMPSPQNGRFVYSPVGYRAPFPVGSTATLVCAENTQMADGNTVSRSAICQYSGWSQLQFDPCLPITSSTGTFK